MLNWVEIDVADAADLPYEDEAFNAVFDVQTLNYIADVDAVLGEIYRVLRPGGRYVNFSVVSSSVVWRSASPSRMQQLLAT